MAGGDALGPRAIADQFADAIAPDLSNRVLDGWWGTILAWCFCTLCTTQVGTTVPTLKLQNIEENA